MVEMTSNVNKYRLEVGITENSYEPVIRAAIYVSVSRLFEPLW